MRWQKVVGRAHQKRDAWWERQRKEGQQAIANIHAEPGTTAWAFLHGPDIVARARINHPEWFDVPKRSND